MSPVLLPVLLAGLLLTLLTAFWLLWPLRGRDADSDAPARALGTRVYRERLQEINADLMSSRIDADSYAVLKIELDRTLLADSAIAAETGRAQRPVRGLALAVLVLLPVAAFALYLGLFLNPRVATDLDNQIALAPVIDQVLAGQEPAADSAGHSLQDFMRALQRRVQQDPDNADAWMTLGIGYLQARDMGPAKIALARAAELRPDDIQVVMTYVQATIMGQQGPMDPMARALLGRILKAEPDHQGALLMLGLGSLRADDQATAREVLGHLQALRAAGAGDGDTAADRQIASLLLEAGDPAAVAAAGVAFPIEVTVAPALARKIPAEATLFIFARNPDGPPMPVAVIRRPVGQFPLRVMLTDADSLQPDRLLSQQKALILQARISRSGNATPSPGDWEAVAVPVTPESRTLVRLRISETR